MVSALNELLAIKSALGVLADKNHDPLPVRIEVVNDELIITERNGDFFTYRPGVADAQRIQKTLFHEKERLIEGCLFGVDINPNSVKICRLRLWIELLKNAYYTANSQYTELETLPNIDINIKTGNSLISRFALDADIKQALRKSKWTISSYQNAVNAYRNALGKDEKWEIEKLINDIKGTFSTEIFSTDILRIKKARKQILRKL